MERGVQRGIHGGWKENETELLWHEVSRAMSDGRPLKHVFDEVAKHTGRKSNSIRNYYYAQRKERGDELPMSRAMPFVPFSEDEVRMLMREVLAARAEGQSVRACVQRLGGGDRALVLRYQNKYRSVLKTRPELVREIIAELRAEGIICPDILKDMPKAEPFEELVREVCSESERLGGQQAGQLLGAINTLLKAVNVRAQSKRRLEEYDRMVVRSDLLRIHLDDMRNRNEKILNAIGGHLKICKEHLGLDRAQRELHFMEFETALIDSLGGIESTISGVCEEQAEDDGIIDMLTLRMSEVNNDMGKVLQHPGNEA